MAGDWTADQLQAFLGHTPDLLCIANDEGFFVALSPNWEDTLGYTIDELLGRPYVEFIHRDHRERTAHVRDSWMRSRDVHTSFDNVYIAKDGSYRHLSWRATRYMHGLTYAIAREVTHERWLIEKVRLSEW